MSRIKSGFNFLSGFYDQLLFITSGNTILKSQLVLADIFPVSENVLILGGGTGAFLVKLLQTGKVKKAVYVDISEGMILKASQKLKRYPAFSEMVEFRCGGLERIAPSEKFDFIITNYFLDVFPEEELRKLIPRLLAQLQPERYWLITDFNASGGRVKRWFFTAVTDLLYLFFRLICGIKCKRLLNIPEFLKKESLVIEKESLVIEKESFILKGFLRSALYKKMPD